VKAYFTSLDRLRPRGREGIYPLIPSVNAILRFTSETNGFYSWELFDIDVVVENFDIEEGSGYVDHMTFEASHEGDAFHDCAPEYLRILSKELHYRAPRWLEKQ